MKEKISRIFIAGFAFLTLVSLLGLEIISYHQYKTEHASRKWVNHTYDVISEIENFGRVFRSYAENPVVSSQAAVLNQLQTQITLLKSMTSDSQSQQALIRDLQRKLRQPVVTNDYIAEIWSTVSLLKQRELLFLKARRAQDEQEASTGNKWIVLSAWSTGALLLLLFALAGLDYRARRRVERSLASTLETMMKTNADLISLNSRKNDMLKTTVHDLKNPLGSIAGFAELIGEESTENQSVLEMVAVVKRISQQTLDLVGGILEESALKHGQTDFANRKINIVDCIRDAVSMLQATAKTKSQSIAFKFSSAALTVDGDDSKLRDAFMNLIGNALKFSPPSTSITVDCERERNLIKITVQDEGPGICPSDRAKLFQRGQRLSAKPTGQEVSTGLGLSIVKETIEKHMGRVFCDASTAPKGACFVVELPVAVTP